MQKYAKFESNLRQIWPNLNYPPPLSNICPFETRAEPYSPLRSPPTPLRWSRQRQFHSQCPQRQSQEECDFKIQRC